MKHPATLAALTFAALLSAAGAQLVGQYGILDMTANGGINPNTGVAWALGDQYRLAFHTDGTINATSDDPSVYDNFATAQAQQNAALATSTGWTAMVYVNTDDTLPQAANPNAPGAGESPVSSPLVRSGTVDSTGGAGQGGAGVPVYAMDGTTAIARNNADIYNSWSNPFESGLGTPDPTGNGNNTQRLAGVYYSPFLDQFAGGDTGANHGANVWTGGFGSAVNPLGNSVDPDTQVRASWGSSNANTTGRVWNRFNGGTTSTLSVYALSPLLTVQESAAPKIPLVITPNDPTSRFKLTWDSQAGMRYNVRSTTNLGSDPATWTLVEGDIAATPPENTRDVDPTETDLFYVVEEFPAPPVEIFSQSFDGAAGPGLPTGWTSGTNPADNSSLTSWEVGTPSNVGPVPPGVPLPSGANCVATNIGGNYDDPVTNDGLAHTDIWLRSPAIDLGSATAGTLSFQQWTQIEDVPGDLDHGSIRILDANDDSELAVMEPQSIDGNTSGWEQYSMDLPAAAFTAAAGTIKVEFRFEADDIDSFAGWYIDDVAVTVPGS